MFFTKYYSFFCSIRCLWVAISQLQAVKQQVDTINVVYFMSFPIFGRQRSSSDYLQHRWLAKTIVKFMAYFQLLTYCAVLINLYWICLSSMHLVTLEKSMMYLLLANLTNLRFKRVTLANVVDSLSNRALFNRTYSQFSFIDWKLRVVEAVSNFAAIDYTRLISHSEVVE